MERRAADLADVDRKVASASGGRGKARDRWRRKHGVLPGGAALRKPEFYAALWLGAALSPLAPPSTRPPTHWTSSPRGSSRGPDRPRRRSGTLHLPRSARR